MLSGLGLGSQSGFTSLDQRTGEMERKRTDKRSKGEEEGAGSLAGLAGRESTYRYESHVFHLPLFSYPS